jgi:hypothetical protein
MLKLKEMFVFVVGFGPVSGLADSAVFSGYYPVYETEASCQMQFTMYRNDSVYESAFLTDGKTILPLELTFDGRCSRGTCPASIYESPKQTSLPPTFRVVDDALYSQKSFVEIALRGVVFSCQLQFPSGAPISQPGKGSTNPQPEIGLNVGSVGHP